MTLGIARRARGGEPDLLHLPSFYLHPFPLVVECDFFLTLF
jgi:hypothetical protein